MIPDGFYRVTTKFAVAGFEVRNGLVSETDGEVAPILKWAKGKPATVVSRWANNHGGQVELVAAQLTL